MNEIVRVDKQAAAEGGGSAGMLAIISRAASDPNVDMDKLERLMAMKERMDAQVAESAFNSALSDAQGAMRPISADATNPQTRSKYATYAQLDKALRPIYTSNGLSLSFDTDDSPKSDHVRVLCYVAHSGGFKRTYKADMPIDGKGAKGNDVMTKTHAFGAGTSYGMRYLLKMIFNVAIGEDDNDGNGYAAVQYVSAEQLRTLQDLVDVYVRNVPKFLEWISARAGFSLETLGETPAKLFNEVHGQLKKLRQEQAEGAK